MAIDAKVSSDGTKIEVVDTDTDTVNYTLPSSLSTEGNALLVGSNGDSISETSLLNLNTSTNNASVTGTLGVSSLTTATGGLQVPNSTFQDLSGTNYFANALGNRGGDITMNHIVADLGDTPDPGWGWVVVCRAYVSSTGIKNKEIAHGVVRRSRGSTGSFNVSSEIHFHAASGYNSNEGGSIQMGNGSNAAVQAFQLTDGNGIGTGEFVLGVWLHSTSSTSVNVDIWYGAGAGITPLTPYLYTGQTIIASDIATGLTSSS
jgi:hypothetical protein